MSQHDKLDALQRWFEDWKVERHAAFPWDHQWMTVEETVWISPRGRKHVRYVGGVGDYDRTEPSRKVLFEMDAPAPPVFRLDVRRVPPPEPPRRSRPPLRLNDYEQMYEHQLEAIKISMLMPMRYLVERRILIGMDDFLPPPPPEFTGSNQ